MAATSLPPLSESAFASALEAGLEGAGVDLSAGALPRLHRHYVELRRWAPRLSLVGPGTATEAVERHFVESLLALPWTPRRGTVLDVGSGAGFPGLVLAAARPELDVVLVEARQRKWAFLEAVRRGASLSCRCLNATVGGPDDALPGELDLVTLRALRLPPAVLADLASRLRPGGGILFWSGEEDPVLPETLEIDAERPLPGARRRLVRARPRGEPGGSR
ncbi:MAG: RsmG family class I SAM-dependent methyltransferase [Thermoanaerobaculia bacterium]